MILSERICGKAVRVPKKQIVGILFDICFPMAESMTAPTWTSNSLPWPWGPFHAGSSSLVFFPYINCSIWKFPLDCFLNDYSGNSLGFFCLLFFFFFFSLLELTTVTVLKLIALTIGSFITSYQALRLNSVGLWIDLLEIACNLSVKILDYKIFVTLGLWKCISRILLTIVFVILELWGLDWCFRRQRKP